MEIFTQEGLAMLSRWGHFLAGITWIGLLYYFNFVQTPAFVEFDAGPRTEAFRKLVPRALWWFRWGALLTVITGLLILGFEEEMTGDYMKTPQGMGISTGILFGLIMFTNVWGIIWRNQKVVIANAEATAAGREGLPHAAAAARRAACASRTNTLLSIPLLFFMGFGGHMGGFYDQTPEGGTRAMYWAIVLVITAVIEIIAILAPSPGKPQAWHIDKHKNTIIAGFAYTALLILLFELIVGGGS